jgi:hypothetical protein
MTDIAAEVIQIIELIEVEIRILDMSYLCDEFSLRSLHCDLYIAGYNKYVAMYEFIAFAHPIKAVIQSEVFGAALKHCLADVEDTLQDSVIIHNFPQ